MAEEETETALQEMRESFQRYRNTFAEKELSAYQLAEQELMSKIARYEGYAGDTPETQNDLRRLKNFCSYQARLLTEYDERPIEELYQLASYVDRGLELHQAELREMAQTDLQVSRSVYQRQQAQMLRWMTWILVLALLLTAALVIWTLHTGRLIERVWKQIQTRLEELSAHHWEMPDLHIGTYLEFEMIAKALNMMTAQIRAYLAQIKRDGNLAVQLKEEQLLNERQRTELISAQMSALRAQVNPHFLFNALNMIGGVALLQTPQTVMKLVEATGQILRYSLYTSENRVPLDDEMNIVKQYLFLQKYRFGDRLHVEMENWLEGEEVQIPPMAVQPIVENCFKHGMQQKKEFAVSVHVFTEDGMIKVCVADNGVGFENGAVQEKKKSGIGLSNIEERMRLIYGGCGPYVRIERKAGRTEVSLCVPEREIGVSKDEADDCGR